MARCECEKPIVFRGEETCLKCGRAVATVPASTRRILTALIDLARHPRGREIGNPDSRA